MDLKINRNNEVLNLPNEVWKDMANYEKYYQVSNLGRIRTKKRIIYYDRNLGRGVEPKTIYTRIRKQKFNKHTGYLMIILNIEGQQVTELVHTLVAKTFIENFQSEGRGRGKVTNHIDGDKLNNNVNNLEVIEYIDNVRHAFKTGLARSRVKYKDNIYPSKRELRKRLDISQGDLNILELKGQIELLDIRR